MKPTKDTFENITQGITSVVFEEERYRFIRFDEAEITTVDSEISSCTAGIKMDFITDGTLLRMTVDVEKALERRSFFAFDVFVNGEFLGSIKNFDEATRVGDYANQEYELGIFSEEFELGEGKKQVTIFFPHSVRAFLRDFEIVNATYILPIRKEKRIVAYGDSITQGFDALHPSHAYVVQLAEYFDAELMNKGIGGACFCPQLVEEGESCQADYVVVAYGTNDWTCHTADSFRTNVRSFLDVLTKKYRNSKIFVITPIWRQDYVNERAFGPFFGIASIIREECRPYRQICVVSGWDLVPHNERLFGDQILHPNDEGFAFYFSTLQSRLRDELSHE